MNIYLKLSILFFILAVVTGTLFIRFNSPMPEKKYLTLQQFEQKYFTPLELKAIRMQMVEKYSK